MNSLVWLWRIILAGTIVPVQTSREPRLRGASVCHSRHKSNGIAGFRIPDSASEVLLRVIVADPDLVERVVREMRCSR
jgi:hypothetical protein